MELTGNILQVMPEVNGAGRNGNTWRKREFILEIPGQYPKKVCISVWGDKIDQFPLQTGNQVTASIDVESREYNGRWYTEVKAWKVQAGQGAPVAAPNQGVDAMPSYESFDANPSTDDLPF